MTKRQIVKLLEKHRIKCYVETEEAREDSGQGFMTPVSREEVAKLLSQVKDDKDNTDRKPD